MNIYEKAFTQLGNEELKTLNELVLGNDFDKLTRRYIVSQLEEELVNVNATIDVYYKAQPNELFNVQVNLMELIKYFHENSKERNLVQRTVEENSR